MKTVLKVLLIIIGIGVAACVAYVCYIFWAMRQLH